MSKKDPKSPPPEVPQDTDAGPETETETAPEALSPTEAPPVPAPPADGAAPDAESAATTKKTAAATSAGTPATLPVLKRWDGGKTGKSGAASKPGRSGKLAKTAKPGKAARTGTDKDGPWIYQTGKEIYQFFGRVKGRLQGIQVFALVGKSGTGKSFRARLLAEKLELSYIIDDGLLIHDSGILAGKSAKQEKNYISAIRTALFAEPEHREAVVRAIQEHKIKRILLLGTSEKMVARVAEALELPPISQIVHIEEIASQEDIENAIKSRFEEGKHVIPVPAIEIKRAFIQNLSDTIRIFFKGARGKDGSQRSRFFEKSVVQPDFQEKRESAGIVTISEAALSQMIIHCVDEYDDEILVQKIRVRVDRNKGYGIDLGIEVPFGKPLSGGLHELTAYIIHHIQKYTGIIIERLEIKVEKVSRRQPRPAKKA